MLLTVGDDDRNPETLPVPSSGDATPTEPLAPLPITMPLPAHVPPRPGLAPSVPEVPEPEVPEPEAPESEPEVPESAPEVPESAAEAGAPTEAPDGSSDTASEEPGSPTDAPADEDAPDDEGTTEPPRISSMDAPTQAISSIGPAPDLPAQKRPATTRPKQLAWSNLPGSEPIPLGAVAGGFDVTGTHPTLPPVSSYTAAIAAAHTAAVAAGTATAATSTPAAAAAATGATPTAPVETEAPAPQSAPPSAVAAVRKRRRRRALIATLATTAVVLVVLGVAGAIGWQVAETHASSVVKQTVQQKVDQAFGLPASHPVAVTFDEPVLPQTWAGKLDRLTFTVAGVPLVGTTGTVTVHATDVPTDGTGEASQVQAAVRLKPDALKALVSANRTTLGQILPESVEVDGNRVTVSLNPAQFLSGVSFTEVLTARIEHGNLVLTPDTFVVGGLPMSADTVRARFGGLAQGILASRTICLADTHPTGMTLTALHVKKDAVVADFDVQPGILTDPALQAKGTCK